MTVGSSIVEVVAMGVLGSCCAIALGEVMDSVSGAV